MSTKEELLEALDAAEKTLGHVLAEAVGSYVVDNGAEPMSIQQARINYAAGGLWLRHWLERDYL